MRQKGFYNLFRVREMNCCLDSLMLKLFCESYCGLWTKSECEMMSDERTMREKIQYKSYNISENEKETKTSEFYV